MSVRSLELCVMADSNSVFGRMTDERMRAERFCIASCRNKMLSSLALNINIFFLFYMHASISDPALRSFLEIRTQAMSTGSLELQWIIIHLFLNAR